MQMTKRKASDWQPDARGRYSRRVGMSFKDQDKPVSLTSLEERKSERHMFHFGTDLPKARARLMRVEELWAHVVDLCNRPPEEHDMQALFLPEPKREPVWGGALWIAKQLAAGKVQMVVERYDRESDHAYAAKINHLASTYPCIVFVPEDREAHEAGANFMRSVADHQLRRIQKLNPNVLPTTSASLHEGLDTYIEYIKKDAVTLTDDGLVLTSFGALKIGQVNRLKAHHPDFPLSSLDLDKCQDMIDHWRNRPASDDKRNKKPRILAYRSCQNHISELQRFFRWLHRAKAFEWRKPEDFDELVTKVKEVTDERTSIAHETQVRVYTPSELAILYKYATPLERLMILLGLNCGFRGAESGTLLKSHIFLDQPHPNAKYLKEISGFESQPDDRFILYRRNKSKVYGEFCLWPHTVEILRWAIQRRDRICERLAIDKQNLVITEKGSLCHRLTSGSKNRSQIFANKWAQLIKRVRNDHPNFPNHAFKSLRITAGNLMREVAGGEVAAVFLMHGKPVKSDNLLDLYTNRPFGKVFEGLRKVQDKLKSMFEATPAEICEQPVKQHTTLKIREKIVALKQDGNPLPRCRSRA
jgi:tRNA(Ser,Leu) C12 N-acetylase TAN1